MPLTPKLNFDDLCLAMARFLNCLDRADADALKDLYDHVSQECGAEDPLVQQRIQRSWLGEDLVE